ncbi:MAG TPA: hypothetical protein VFI19_03715, partial [Nocardioides sp.]|nr:hypothetical protein [Nocardioides sp.]
MLGPKQRLLASYVANANTGHLDDAGKQWSTAEDLLRRLSGQLDSRSQAIGTDHRFSGSSADAAKKAFSHSSTKMSDRADQMRDGAQAFQDASHALRQAQKASDGFAQHAGDQPPQQPPDRNDVHAQKDWQTQNNQFWKNYDSREGDAGDAIQALQANHRQQAAVFARIHGEPPPPPPPGSPGANPVKAGTAPTPTHLPGGTHLVGTHPTGPGTTNNGNDHHPVGVTDPGSGPGNHQHDNGNVDVPAVQQLPGLPQGPNPVQGTPLPGGLTVPGTITPGGGTVGGGIGAVGGIGVVAGGALGGAAAAGLAGSLAGGLNGGLNGLVPVSGAGVRGGLSASGVRGIGATSRIGTGSVLGRGTGGLTGRAG